MTPEEVIDVTRDALLTVLQVAGPLMAIALAVGLAISLFQALTQIQEQTLSFVPKILLMFAAGVVLMPFMITSLTDFMERIADRIVTLG